METLFWCAFTLAIGVILGIIIEIDIKFYDRRVKKKRDIEVKNARTLMMKIRDRQCLSVNNKCSKCEYNTEEGCLANSALKHVLAIEYINTPDEDEDINKLDEEAIDIE